jgi:hypothetical protein
MQIRRNLWRLVFLVLLGLALSRQDGEALPSCPTTGTRCTTDSQCGPCGPIYTEPACRSGCCTCLL